MSYILSTQEPGYSRGVPYIIFRSQQLIRCPCSGTVPAAVYGSYSAYAFELCRLPVVRTGVDRIGLQQALSLQLAVTSALPTRRRVSTDNWPSGYFSAVRASHCLVACTRQPGPESKASDSVVWWGRGLGTAEGPESPGIRQLPYLRPTCACRRFEPHASTTNYVLCLLMFMDKDPNT